MANAADTFGWLPTLDSELFRVVAFQRKAAPNTEPKTKIMTVLRDSMVTKVAAV